MQQINRLPYKADLYRLLQTLTHQGMLALDPDTGTYALGVRLVRLAQNWVMRYPLIDPQGNFGSVDGDPPAAYRYTESRLRDIAEDLLKDIEEDTVDFAPNYKESTTEPTVARSSGPVSANIAGLRRSSTSGFATPAAVPRNLAWSASPQLLEHTWPY